jgi:hypothetical protein
MTKLDLVLERIRQLPQERQEALAREMEFWLDHDGGGSLLTEEQWAEVEAALKDENEPVIPHDEVFASLRAHRAP